jgi:elongation factor G
MGSAFKNKGVQTLLDGVTRYLPSPMDVPNVGLDIDDDEKEVDLECDPNKPLVALAFKLEESRFGQLTYLRIYQGSLKKGSNVMNVSSGKKVRIPRIVRMHSNEMQDIDVAHAGDVVAVFGVSEVASMDTFTDGTVNIALNSMFVPSPVMSLSIKPTDSMQQANFGKAIGKFTREDPTLRVAMDQKSKETIMSGMGELHLEIYVERMKREYNVDVVTGQPLVAYKETVSNRQEFNYLHKKQSGGSGQYARVIGYVEPLEAEVMAKGIEFEFENEVIGTNIPPEFIPSCRKGAEAACERGALAGNNLSGLRVVLTDGNAHAVDSNDLAFQQAMQYGIRAAVRASNPKILEPVMALEVESPAEFQGTIIGGLNKRSGLIMGTDLNEDGSQVVIKADMPLAGMFGYSTDLRSSTQGKGEFTMEYKAHQPVPKEEQDRLIREFLAKQASKED